MLRRMSALARTLVLVGCLLSACTKSTPSTAKQIELIENDYDRALSLARDRKLPLFVDVWASWCHTCMSMKQYVLPSPALAQLADAFVWLSIDSERADSAAFLKRYPSRSLPTLWVIDAAHQTPLLKWIGAATPEELVVVLRQAKDDAAHPDDTSGAAQATALALRGHRASAAGSGEDAISLYQQALQQAPAEWPMRARAVEALSMRLAEADRDLETFELALREAPALPASTARLNVVLNGIDAAADSPLRTSAPARWATLVDLGTRIAEDASPSLLLDDRSSLYLSLVSALKKSEPERAQKLARTWSGLLDAEAARARTPAARRVWDAHRLEAYLLLNEPQKALPMLEQSEREDPTDFNPPARLTRTYLALGRAQEASAAIERALARSDGPRKLRLYMLKADALVAQGEAAGARASLQAALDFARDKQLGRQYDKLKQKIEQRLREMS